MNILKNCFRFDIAEDYFELVLVMRRAVKLNDYASAYLWVDFQSFVQIIANFDRNFQIRVYKRFVSSCFMNKLLVHQ